MSYDISRGEGGSHGMFSTTNLVLNVEITVPTEAEV